MDTPEELDPTAPMEFVLERTVVPVKITGKDGVVVEYTLEEMDGKARDAYLTASSKRIKMQGGVVNTSGMNFDGLQAELLTRCMYGPDHTPVTLAEIQGWRSSISAALFKRAQQVNGLTPETKETVKND